MPIDYAAARHLLNDTFTQIESRAAVGESQKAPEGTEPDFDHVFESRTQSFREMLLGCAVARLQDKALNIRLPYVNLGEAAFNGRTLDERAVNPFLREHRVPSSTGPYLAKARRSIRFDQSFLAGTRDRAACQSFLDLVAWLESKANDDEILAFVEYLLYRFIRLREAASIPISALRRISLEQFSSLIDSLLEIRSGGRIPVFLVVAAFRAVNDYFSAGWEIELQGINVADSAGGAGGDVTIRQNGAIILAAEITERPIDRNRVAYTFQTKVAPNAIEDYLFFSTANDFPDEVLSQARQYFTQGHAVNFLSIRDWIISVLAVVGARGRDIFNRRLVELIEAGDVPRNIKVGWNQRIERLASG